MRCLLELMGWGKGKPFLGRGGGEVKDLIDFAIGMLNVLILEASWSLLGRVCLAIDAERSRWISGRVSELPISPS